MTVQELLTRTSAAELDEWAVFFAMEPRGDERLDLHFARLMHMYASAKAGRGRRFDLQDFMIEWRWRAEAETDVELARELLAQFEDFERDYGRRNR